MNPVYGLGLRDGSLNFYLHYALVALHALHYHTPRSPIENYEIPSSTLEP